MIIFLKTGGEVAYVSDENINLGSDKANSLFVVAPYAAASSVCVAFKLPNGKTLGPGFVVNQGVVSFDSEVDFYEMQKNGSIPEYTFEEQELSAWSYDIQSVLTGVSGTLGIQLFIFADGRCISTNLINTTVNVGVNNLVIPSIDTTGNVYEQILYYLENIYDEAETAVSSATAAAESAASSANEAQAWANGTYVDEEGNSQSVAEDAPQYQNNAEYYAEQAAESAESAQNYAEVIAPQEATAAAQAVLADTENHLDTLEAGMDSAKDRLDNTEDRLDNVDYILEQFGAVKAQVDSSAALVKSVPARSDLFAYLNSVGGKTEKYNQLLTNRFWQFADISTADDSGVTITDNDDGTFTLNGTATNLLSFTIFDVSAPDKKEFVSTFPTLTQGADLYVSLKNDFGGEGYCYFNIYGRDNVDESDGVAAGDQWGDLFIGSYANGTRYGYGTCAKKYITKISVTFQENTVFNNYVFAPMFNLGTAPQPWQSPADPFTGLRSGKVTALKVYVSNLFNPSACLNKNFIDNGDGTYTMKRNGDERFSAWGDIYIPANTVFRVSGTLVKAGAANVNIYFRFADGSTNGHKAIDNTRSAYTFDKDIVAVCVYMVGVTSSAPSEAIVSNLMISYANVPYYPYKEPTTYALPEAVQNLPMYGHSIDASTANIIGFEKREYTYPCVLATFDGSDDENWRQQGDPNQGQLAYFYSTIGAYGSVQDRKIKSSLYEAAQISVSNKNKGIDVTNSSTYLEARILVRPYESMTLSEFINNLRVNPLYVIYAVTDPDTLDISAELEGFDPVFSVEPGGRIEIANKYNYDVPSTITYNIIQEA